MTTEEVDRFVGYFFSDEKMVEAAEDLEHFVLYGSDDPHEVANIDFMLAVLTDACLAWVCVNIIYQVLGAKNAVLRN